MFSCPVATFLENVRPRTLCSRTDQGGRIHRVVGASVLPGSALDACFSIVCGGCDSRLFVVCLLVGSDPELGRTRPGDPDPGPVDSAMISVCRITPPLLS